MASMPQRSQAASPLRLVGVLLLSTINLVAANRAVANEDHAPPRQKNEESSKDVLSSLPSPHLSYGRLLTYSGIVVDIGQAKEKTVFFDAAEYDGHLDFVVRALKRRTTRRAFLDAVSRPKKRQYFPFLLYKLESPIELAGKNVSYLLRPQRYRFGDSHRDLAALLASVITKIGAATDGAFGTGAVMLYDGTKRRPNEDTADALARHHVASIGLRALLKRVGGSKVQVLHPGTATGRLVRVQANVPPSDFGPDVIAVYDTIPEVAPTFAGIITLEPQTPLSHLNLLAKNRGTVNLSAQSIDDIAELASHIGAPVRLTATPDAGRGGQVTIRRISARELAAATAATRRTLAIPKPRLAPARLLSLHGTPASRPINAKRMVRDVGAKATGYARLFRLLGDTAVRPASALTFGAYLSHLKSSGGTRAVSDLWRSRKRLTREAINQKLLAIRTQILKTRLDPATVDLVARHLEKAYPAQKVRLRSSTNCEDLPAFNGAGLYVSKGLKQKGVSAEKRRRKIDKKLRTIFASLWTERAYWEREFAGIDHRRAAMAVLIHPAFVNEVGDGVALSLDHHDKQRPSTRAGRQRGAPPRTPFQVAVQAQRGGAGVTHPQPGHVAESFLMTKGRPLPGQVDAVSNQGPVLLDNSPKTRAALSEFFARMEQVHTAFVPPARRQRTVTGGRSIVGVDVEFKVMNEDGNVRIYFKQARLLSTPLVGAAH